MQSKKSFTWINYLRETSKSDVRINPFELKAMKDLLYVGQSLNKMLHYSIPAIYLVDYTSGKYLSMSRSTSIILGHRPEMFTDNGVLFTLDNYHKDDFRMFDEEIFPDRIAILKSISPEEHPKHLFSYSFRFKNAEGKYINLLQRNCFVKSDEKGNPLVSMGMIINIDHYRNENPVIQTVEKVGDNEPPVTIYKKTFYLHEEDKLFTPREKEVLLWSAQGLTSKEIAGKLNISECTIINHRRNMQNKSNTANITQLVSFAIRSGII